MLHHFPALNNIFNHDWNPKYGKIENHPLILMASKSESPKYENFYRNELKYKLKNLDKNLQVVKEYLNNKQNKIRELEKRYLNPEQFYEAVIEIAWFAKWISKEVPFDIEPLGKNKGGPDAKITMNEKKIFCEITALDVSDKRKLLSNHERTILENISNIKPSYSVHITIYREINDNDIEYISDKIKQEITRNEGNEHFTAEFPNFYLDFSSRSLPYVEIHYTSLSERSPYVTDTRQRFLKKMCYKIKKMDKAGDYPKVLILDFGRDSDSYGHHPMFTEGSFHQILGRLEFLEKFVLQFDSEELYELSAIITIPHTTNELYSPTCYVNKSAKQIISAKEIATIACL